MTRPLSTAQVRTLRELAKPGVVADYTPYLGTFNQNANRRIFGVPGRCTRQMEVLLKRGYAKNIKMEWSGGRAVVSDTGRAYLEQLDKDGQG